MAAPNSYPLISTLIPSQFPAVYREDGPLFVEFVKQYYEWMESQGPVYYSRKLQNFQDIDTTEESFLVHFKEKYLKNIQFQTATNTRLLVKHSLDLYRSKGTERAINLFFRLVFGEDAQVYYPGLDVMRSSDAKWYSPTYLEVTQNDGNRFFVNKEIIGLNSGATAFVDGVVTRRFQGKYIDVFYISGITKDFITGETITLATADSTVSYVNPIVVGSLTSAIISDGGAGFSIGEIVNIYSSSGRGKQGLGRVSSLASISGAAQITLLDGGWGYSTNSSYNLVSSNVLRLGNVNIVPIDLNTFTFTVGKVIQPLANIQMSYGKYVSNSASAMFAVGDIISTYSGGVVNSTGRVISISLSGTPNSAYILASILTGNLQSNSVYYNQSNSITANSASYVDVSATGTGVGLSSNGYVNYSGIGGSFSIADQIYQVNPLGVETANAIVKSVVANGLIGNLYVTNSIGLFISGYSIYNRSNTAIATVNSIAIDVGIIQTSNSGFVSFPGNFVYEPKYGSNGQVYSVSSGSGANFNVATISYTDDVYLADLILPFKSVSLNSATYVGTGGVTFKLASANHATKLSDALNNTAITVGTISTITAVNPGINYTYAPFITTIEPRIYNFRKRDFIFTLSNTNGSFIPGEIVTQDTTNGRGIVQTSNSTTLYVRRTTFYDKFVQANSTVDYKIRGTTSLANSSLFTLQPQASAFAGFNDVVQTKAVSATGSVASMDIVDSGFGYIDGDTVNFSSLDGTRTGTIKVSLGKQGRGSGKYLTQSGFLSADKYLFDGDYYQDFSYVINTAVSSEKYSDMIDKVLHLSGTKHFYGISKKAFSNTQMVVANAKIVVSNSSYSNSIQL
jgi:hypothetical protein